MENDSLDDKFEKFSAFMQEVKVIEKRDSELTSEKQIERLTKPGSKYLNLNPYEAGRSHLVFDVEVLQVQPDSTEDEVKKAFRKLSILVHPDKNQGVADMAQKAFEAVNKANKMLKDADELKKLKHLLEEAEAMINIQLKEKRKLAKKDNLGTIEEDTNPEKYYRYRRAVTAKLFADYEVKRVQSDEKHMRDRKREREQEIDEEQKVKSEKDFQKKWDEARTGRVDSWRSFQTNNKKKKKGMKPFKPPKDKPESRS